MDMSSAPADAGQEQDLSGGEGEQLQRLAWTAQKSAHACAAFLWCRPTSPDRVRPPGAVVGTILGGKRPFFHVSHTVGSVSTRRIEWA